MTPEEPVERHQSFYERKVFPVVLDLVMNTKLTRANRVRACAGLHGDIVELGFGTGLNLEHLPAEVRSVHAVEPLTLAYQRAGERISASPAEVVRDATDAEHLPYDDHSLDAALSTWTLCSIPDPVQAIREIARVLRPGGTLHFVEHGLAPDPGVRRWQARLNPIQRRLACGCHLDRDIPAIIGQGGLVIEDLDCFYVKGEPKIVGSTYLGTARAA